MLSFDMGTGYYLGMVHFVQQSYERFKYTLYFDDQCQLRFDGNQQSDKRKSDIYFTSNFQFD